MKFLMLLMAFLSSMIVMAQEPDFSMAGFATMEGGTTGGAGGQIVTPTTFQELKQYVEDPSTPYIIKVDKEFNTGVQTWVDADGGIVESSASGAIETTFGAILRVGANKTILGVEDKAFFNRIGLVIQCKSNIIIRNIKFTMQHVPAARDGEYKILDTDGVTTLGDPDCIGIQADAESVPEAQRKSWHIWIDHCEFYNENISNKDRYDGLVDNKNNVKYLTISWCYFHDHSKALLSGSGGSDEYNRLITFHHNYFARIDGSRLPLLRYGQHHYFNNYVEDCPGDGVNVRINSNAYIEQNYFKNSKKPVFGKISENGQAKLVDNIFEECSRLPSGITNINGAKSDPLSESEEFVRDCNFTPSELYDYAAVLHAVADVPAIVAAYSGVGVISDEEPEPEPEPEPDPDSVLNVQPDLGLYELAYVKDGVLTIRSAAKTIVTIHALDGKVLYHAVLQDELNTIPLSAEGVFVVRLHHARGATAFKVVF